MPISFVFAVLALIVVGGWLFVRFYRTHLQGNNAPEQKVQVTILDKQAIAVADAQPGEDNQEYWIYVQRGSLGPKREFQVGIHYFHALNPGDRGELTYKGDKFLHFALKR